MACLPLPRCEGRCPNSGARVATSVSRKGHNRIITACLAEANQKSLTVYFRSFLRVPCPCSLLTSWTILSRRTILVSGVFAKKVASRGAWGRCLRVPRLWTPFFGRCTVDSRRYTSPPNSLPRVIVGEKWEARGCPSPCPLHIPVNHRVGFLAVNACR